MRALITGIAGQDGSYLAELLLEKGYEVHGLLRRGTGLHNIEPFAHRLRLHPGDLCDQSSLDAVVNEVQPVEVYHLGAQSFVQHSFTLPVSTSDVTGIGTLRMLEAVRRHAPKARFYTAGSSEQFGKAPPPQNEQTRWHPRSPYGVAKVFACEITRNYREAYGLFACTGILMNHESPRRGPEFVTRKVSLGVARIACGLQQKIGLGNLDARRDWGHARDYVRAMQLMLARDTASDFVIGTGVSHSVAELVEVACRAAGLPGPWQDYVELDPSAVRPAEVDDLRADATHAREVLGWEPTTTFDELVREMVESDLARTRAAQR